MSKYPHEWPEARTERLRRLWNEGLSFGKIGKKLRLSREAVAGKCDRLGLMRGGNQPKIADARVLEIIVAYQTGNRSLRTLAGEYGVAKSTMARTLAKHGVKMNPMGRRRKSPSVHGAPG